MYYFLFLQINLFKFCDFPTILQYYCSQQSYYFYYHNKFNFVLLSHLTFLITALSLNALTCHFE